MTSASGSGAAVVGTVAGGVGVDEAVLGARVVEGGSTVVEVVSAVVLVAGPAAGLGSSLPPQPASRAKPRTSATMARRATLLATTNRSA